MYAHYFASRTIKYVVITPGAELHGPDVKQMRVSGKREARQIAAQHNAQPWNF